MKPMATVWIVDDDASIRWVLDKALSNAGFKTKLFENADDVLTHAKQHQPDVIVTDIRMPGTSGLELLDQMVSELPEIPVIVMTAHSDLDSAVSAYQGGAFEYLPKPFDLEEAVALVTKALQKKSSARAAASENPQVGQMIG
ncbi:MAG: response regulator, partial [Proteobacteria bacterium]|nr:response regulator [Pseudomonadota bacterium]